MTRDGSRSNDLEENCPELFEKFIAKRFGEGGLVVWPNGHASFKIGRVLLTITNEGNDPVVAYDLPKIGTLIREVNKIRLD